VSKEPTTRARFAFFRLAGKDDSSDRGRVGAAEESGDNQTAVLAPPQPQQVADPGHTRHRNHHQPDLKGVDLEDREIAVGDYRQDHGCQEQEAKHGAHLVAGKTIGKAFQQPLLLQQNHRHHAGGDGDPVEALGGTTAYGEHQKRGGLGGDAGFALFEREPVRHGHQSAHDHKTKGEGNGGVRESGDEEEAGKPDDRKGANPADAVRFVLLALEPDQKGETEGEHKAEDLGRKVGN